MMTKLLALLPLLLWSLAWALSGYLIAHQVFRLRRDRLIVGLSLGFAGHSVWFRIAPAALIFAAR
jgi:ABC-type uncharacterized transport system permease subunit